MHVQQWHRHRRLRFAAAVCSATALTLAAAACSSTSSNTSSSGGTRISGGTAAWAEQPSAVPNYIFPFVSGTYASTANISEFQYLMYRPLYWFGNGTSPTFNASLSLATAPVYNGTTVTITMKGWKWSNGETVTAQDVLFWIHMQQAVGAQDWFDFVPGLFPSNVSDVKAVSSTELTMKMNKPYNTTWFTYNELSQITPLPAAWDRTASGPSDCAAVVADCAKVYSYLDSQSKALSSWASSPIWSVVDGPWKLTAYTSDGHATFVPNRAYSGPVKPTLAKFEEVQFTTESAEYNVLQAGAAGGGQKLDFGYLPTTDAPDKPASAAVGQNPVGGYTLAPLIEWAINYFPVNMQSTTGNGPVLSQLYFRQALQYLMNQKAVIDGPLHGYGTYTVGPVGTYPATSYLSPQGHQGDPYPFNPAKAKSLLASHGWNVVPNGVTTCQNPSLCGPGIAKGHQLVFNLPYYDGTNWLGSEMTQLQSNASLAGIKLNLQPKPFDQVTAIGAPNCKVAGTSCNWDMADWGGGWSFSPDYYPSGETLFTSGSAVNSGGYTSSQNDSLITATLTTNSLAPLYNWQNYVTAQLPYIWQPNAPFELSEVADNLRGALPQNSTGQLNPEDWYFVK